MSKKTYWAGRVKIAKIEVMIKPEVKKEFIKLLRQEGKKASNEIGIWIREYIRNQKIKLNK